MELVLTRYLPGAGMVRIMLLVVVEVSGKKTHLFHREGKAIAVLDLEMVVEDHLHLVAVDLDTVVVKHEEGILRVIIALDTKILHIQAQVEVTRIILLGEARWSVSIEGCGLPEWRFINIKSPKYIYIFYFILISLDILRRFKL